MYIKVGHTWKTALIHAHRYKLNTLLIWPSNNKLFTELKTQLSCKIRLNKMIITTELLFSKGVGVLVTETVTNTTELNFSIILRIKRLTTSATKLIKYKLFTKTTECMLCAIVSGFCVSRKGKVVGSPAGYDAHHGYCGWQ